MTEINSRSASEAAAFLLDHSDYVGFGFVKDISRPPAIHQQEIDYVLRLKGPRDTIALAPERIDGVTEYNSLYAKWVYWRPDELRLYAMIAIKDGAAIPTCHNALIQAQSITKFYRALIVEAARRRIVDSK